MRRFLSTAARDCVRAYDVNVHNVPRLPVPAVEHTMTRYLETMRPLLSDAEYERTVQQTKDFVGSPVAKQLQEHVLKVAKGEGCVARAEGRNDPSDDRKAILTITLKRRGTTCITEVVGR
jgi:hypothetical protein